MSAIYGQKSKELPVVWLVVGLAGPITFPARFRFVHEAGQNYRHYIEATFFGLPLLKVNEHFLDGRTVLLTATVTWFDDGSPWAYFQVEELLYNADVSVDIRASGP